MTGSITDSPSSSSSTSLTSTASVTPSKTGTASKTPSGSVTQSFSATVSPTGSHTQGVSASLTVSPTPSRSLAPLPDALVWLPFRFTSGSAAVVLNASVAAALRVAVATLAGVPVSRVFISNTTNSSGATTAYGLSDPVNTGNGALGMRALQAGSQVVTQVASRTPSPTPTGTTSATLTPPPAPSAGSWFTVGVAITVPARAIAADDGSGQAVVAEQAGDVAAIVGALMIALANPAVYSRALYGASRAVEAASGFPVGFVTASIDAARVASSVPPPRYIPAASPAPVPWRLDDGPIAGVFFASATLLGVCLASLFAVVYLRRRKQRQEEVARDYATSKVIQNHLATLSHASQSHSGGGSGSRRPSQYEGWGRSSGGDSVGGGHGDPDVGPLPSPAAFSGLFVASSRGATAEGGGRGGTPMRQALPGAAGAHTPSSRRRPSPSRNSVGTTSSLYAPPTAVAPHARPQLPPDSARPLSPAAAMRASQIDPFAAPTIYSYQPDGQLVDGGFGSSYGAHGVNGMGGFSRTNPMSRMARASRQGLGGTAPSPYAAAAASGFEPDADPEAELPRLRAPHMRPAPSPTALDGAGDEEGQRYFTAAADAAMAPRPIAAGSAAGSRVRNLRDVVGAVSALQGMRKQHPAQQAVVAAVRSASRRRLEIREGEY